MNSPIKLKSKRERPITGINLNQYISSTKSIKSGGLIQSEASRVLSSLDRAVTAKA